MARRSCERAPPLTRGWLVARTLRTRILEIIAALGVVLTISLLGIGLSDSASARVRAARMRGTILVQSLAASADGIMGPQGLAILRHLEGLTAKEVEVLRLDVVDVDGAVLHSSDESQRGASINVGRLMFAPGESWLGVDWRGPSTFSASALLHGPDGHDGYLVMTYRSDEASREISNEITTTLIVAAFWIVLTGVVAVALVNRAMRPLVRLSSAVEGLPSGDFELDVQPVQVHEIDVLQRQFRVAADVIRAKERENQALLDSLRDKVEAASHELRQANLFLRSILRSLRNAVLTTDTDGVITSANDRAHETLRVEPERLLPRARTRLPTILPEPARAEAAIEEVLSSRRSISYDAQSPSGRALQIDLAPLCDADELQLGCVARIADVSVQRRLEEQVQRTKRLATVGSVAAAFAHEFGNAMHVVLGLAKVMLAEVPDGSVMHRDLRAIIDEGELASALITRFKQFGRLSSGKFEDVDIGELVQQAASAVSAETAVQGVELSLEIEGHPRVHGDVILLRQALMNLLLNAVQAMPDGGTLQVDARDGSEVELRISDSGPGIPQAVLPKIFEPFFTTRADEDGTGLGLAIVHAIVTVHGGQIRAESPPGQGATFVIELPTSLEPEGGQEHGVSADPGG